MSSYSLLTTLNGKRWDVSSNNITTTNYISCNGGSQLGTYYSNNGNAVRFPSGSTALRPVPAYDGYLRYNTDTSINAFEYFIADTNQWVPITSPPTITSIFPTYVTDASGIAGYYNINQNPLIVNGTGFQSGATVAYRSQSGILYYAADVSFNSTFTLKASVPSVVYSGITGHGDDPFSIIVTNPSGLFAILPNALDSNPAPVWTTPAGSLGTFDASTNLTTQVQVVATDPEGQPIGYALTPGNSLPPGISLGVSTGYITGILPTLPNSTTYNFSIDASDNVTRVPRSFSLTVNGPRTATVSFPSTTWTYTISYSSSTGAGSFGTPQPGGFTIYTFIPALTPASQATITSPPLSQTNATDYTQNSATAVYTFVPNFSSSTCSILLVGGGGAGGADAGSAAGNGGGGGGGVLYNSGTFPLVSGTSYTITVGAGGNGAGTGPATTGPNTGKYAGYKRNGANTTITATGVTLTAFGGGGGGWYSAGWGAEGGSGGGAGASSSGTGSGSKASTAVGASGFTSYEKIGAAPSSTGGGGGGAQVAGSGVNGGDGVQINIVGTNTYYAGGGGGTPNGAGTPTTGGGGAGGNPAVNGTDWLGGGGGSQGTTGTSPAGNGGTGVVIIKFKTYSG